MKKLFFFAAMSSMLFCACNQEELKSAPTPEKAPLTFSNVMEAELTRAATSFDSFMIFLSKDAGSFYTKSETREVTGTDGTWTYTDPIYLNTVARDLYAWTPKDASVVATDASVTYSMTATNPVDLMYQAKTSVDAANASVNLTMSHAYAKLTFTLTKVNYGGTGELTALTVDGVPSSATFNLADGTVTEPGAAAKINVVSASQDFIGSVSALVVPATPTALSVECTLDGTPYTVDLSSKITALAPGTEYKVGLKITGQTFEIGTVTENPWTADTSAGDNELVKK